MFLADFCSDFLLKVLSMGENLELGGDMQKAAYVSRCQESFYRVLFFGNSAEVFQGVPNIVISNNYLTVAVHLTVHVFFPTFVHGWKSRFLLICCLLS